MRNSARMEHVTQKHNYLAPGILLSTYIIYAFTCIVLKANPVVAIYAGYLLTAGDTILNLSIIAFSYWLWRNALKDTKKLFLFFTLSFAFVLIPNALYQILFNIFQLRIPYFSSSNTQLLSHHFLYSFCILFEFFAWLTIVVNAFPIHLRSKIYKSVTFTVTSIIFLAIFICKNDHISISVIVKCFEIYITIFYLINFILAMFCLSLCKKKSLFYLSLGYMIIIGADMIMELGFLSQHLGNGSFFDTSWVLGLLFMLYGFFCIKKDNDHKQPFTDWIFEFYSIKSQSSVWGIALCNISLSIFFTAKAFFIETTFLPLPDNFMKNIFPSMVAYLIVTTAISNIFARKFYNSLAILETKINCFIKNHAAGIGENLKSEKKISKIIEIQQLEEFLNTATNIVQIRSAEKELVKVAKETAHDILSPVAALNFVLETIPDINIEQRDLIKKIEKSISNIAKRLMKKSENIKKQKKEQDVKLIPSTLSSVINTVYEQKNYTFKNTNIKFTKNISSDADEFRVLINPDILERILFNILNNAKEAIDATKCVQGSICLSLEKQGTNMAVTVSDNGSGMAEEVKAKIGKEEVSLNKENGHGIGLYSAIKTIVSWNGSYSIDTNPNKGTQFTIYLPIF